MAVAALTVTHEHGQGSLSVYKVSQAVERTRREIGDFYTLVGTRPRGCRIQQATEPFDALDQTTGRGICLDPVVRLPHEVESQRMEGLGTIHR